MSSCPRVPFKESEVADYERRRYKGIDQRLVHRRELRILKKALRFLGEEVPAGSSGLALDAPSGYRPVSCDLSRAMVSRACGQDYIAHNPMGIVADVTRGLPFRDGAFPLVFSLRFFHHLHQPEERRAALGEFARTGSGWLILSFYRSNALHRAQRTIRRRLKRSRTRIKMISGREFRREAAGAGFRVVCVFPLFRGIHAQHIVLLKRASGASGK
jgi:hypothetical protein